jgi:hypothetical protein
VGSACATSLSQSGPPRKPQRHAEIRVREVPQEENAGYGGIDAQWETWNRPKPRSAKIAQTALRQTDFYNTEKLGVIAEARREDAGLRVRIPL